VEDRVSIAESEATLAAVRAMLEISAQEEPSAEASPATDPVLHETSCDQSAQTGQFHGRRHQAPKACPPAVIGCGIAS
jgi:hypothetical protein